MFPYLFLIFIIVPVIEIYLLITVGSIIGAWITILLIIATAMIGSVLLRQQGISALQRAQHNMQRGEAPAQELLEGLVLLIGGLLLITPGFFTDVLGFICLIPPLRRGLIRFFMQRLLQNIVVMQSGYSNTQEGTIIDGEYQKEKDESWRLK
ncbi:FxsA family protein [Candidatus Venteria ishoeyi]|uniref:Phage T7 F exclusion suppressor FxsA n=1 Tax=Candidatus Venteria ishoeyi TaxID=1899563 RepID=A0A1H6FDV0_9GAMM|nr:FxsA family protein [Candidatus Venteria ishoeyi]MDM8546965.1 FxsA family protein [Candidatus Venteria ishoeyi]SEH07336.1 phage T7 F exclusion suppressor FxsA [Candidatus Venteria ishoeyi]